MRLFRYILALNLLTYLLSSGIAWGQLGEALPFGQPEVGSDMSVQVEAKDESWYSISLKNANVGTMHTTFNELTKIAENKQTAKSYQFAREITLNKPTALSYTKLIEETQFDADTLQFQKCEIRISLVDKRNIIIRGQWADGKVKFKIITKNPAAKDEQALQTVDQELVLKKGLYSEQLLGVALMSSSWEINQPQSIQLINPANSSNYFPEATFVIKGKITDEIMGVPTDGYLCTLAIADKTAGPKETEYFIGTDGVLRKATLGDITILKVKQESVGGVVQKNVFDRKGRVDPFIAVTTPTTPHKGSPGPGPGIRPQPGGTIEADALVRESEELLRQMKEIWQKTPPEDRNSALEGRYKKIFANFDQVNLSSNIKAKSEMARIYDEAKQLFSGVENVYAEASSIRDGCQKDFELMDFEQIPSKLQRMEALLETPGLKGTPFYDKIKKLVDDVKELDARAKVIVEFLGARPSINGIFYYLKSEEVKLPPLSVYFLGTQVALPITYFNKIPDSTVIIANKTYKEGATVSDNLTIKKILRNAIIFNYKNEEIKIEFKGK